MIKLNFTKISLNYVGKQRIMRKWMNSTGEIRNKSEQLSQTLIFFPYRIMVCKKGFKDIFYQILFKKFFKKIITKLYSIIFIVLQYSNFCHFGILGAPGSSFLVGGRREISGPQKTPSGKQHPNIHFWYFQNNWYKK